jgi:hypothetical protein
MREVHVSTRATYVVTICLFLALTAGFVVGVFMMRIPNLHAPIAEIGRFRNRTLSVRAALNLP